MQIVLKPPCVNTSLTALKSQAIVKALENVTGKQASICYTFTNKHTTVYVHQAIIDYAEGQGYTVLRQNGQVLPCVVKGIELNNGMIKVSAKDFRIAFVGNKTSDDTHLTSQYIANKLNGNTMNFTQYIEYLVKTLRQKAKDIFDDDWSDVLIQYFIYTYAAQIFGEIYDYSTYNPVPCGSKTFEMRGKNWYTAAYKTKDLPKLMAVQGMAVQGLVSGQMDIIRPYIPFAEQ